jgi:hypothetical protein
MHRDTGFVFEIAPVQDSDEEGALVEGEEELAFNPIVMGLAAQVLHPD